MALRGDWIERRRKGRAKPADTAAERQAATTSLLKLMPLILGSSVLAAAITQSFTYVLEQRKRAQIERHSALRVATTLEAYAQRAYERAFMCALARETKKDDWWKDPIVTESFPVIDNYPPEIDWSVLDFQAASEALTLPEVIRTNAHYLPNSNEFERKDYLCDMMVEYGNASRVVAWKLRLKHGLPPRPIMALTTREALKKGFPKEDLLPVIKK